MVQAFFAKSALVISALAFVGCYSPQLSSPGYYCHAQDNPACPDGQKCVNGRCTSGPGGGGNDFAVPLDGGGGGNDFATGSHDLASGGPHDFAMQPQPDFSMGGMLCQCPTVQCSLGCVGQDCCLEETVFGLCTADPTCTPH